MQRSTAREPMSWDDVRLFLALCRGRTLNEASAALAVDASTVSRRLAGLERALGVSLFDRGRDGIQKTKAAEDLMPVAEEMEAVSGRFANAVGGLEREATGIVRIASPPDVGEVVVVPILGELRARHPKLNVVLDVGEAVLDLTRREADVALRVVRPTHGDLVVTKLATASWVLAATPEFTRSAGTVRAWTDVPWIGWGERLAQIGPARWLARHAPDVAPVVRSDSLALQIAVVRSGLGVALVPEPSVAHYGLVRVKLAPALREAAAAWPKDDLHLVTHRALRDVPRVRVVWDALVAALK